VEMQAQQLAAAFANMAEGVLVTDMSARVTALNPSVERIFSIKAGDAITRPLLEVIPNAGLSGICARALSGGKPASEEMELTTPVRGVFSVNAVPIFEGGAVSGCLMVVHDITEVRRLEAKGRPVHPVSAGSSKKLCLLAEGSADVYPRYGPTMEWDTAAGQAVLEAAGGSMLAVDGGRRFAYNKEDLTNGGFLALAPGRDEGYYSSDIF